GIFERERGRVEGALQRGAISFVENDALENLARLARLIFAVFRQRNIVQAGHEMLFVVFRLPMAEQDELSLFCHSIFPALMLSVILHSITGQGNASFQAITMT